MTEKNIKEVPTHFTYRVPEDLENLNQGDILYKTDEIRELLDEVHPHYLKEDYKYFIVLTQSCDLVLRGKKECKARYITLAAVRPLDTVLERELVSCQKHQIESVGGICAENYKTRLFQFLERILNNNHPEYFYLHEDEAVAFLEPCCSFLRLSIAVRSEEHYEKCLNAKFIELTEEFRAKLGWLVGNLYSRVGTKDWVPDGGMTKGQFKDFIDKQLDRKVLWVDKKRLSELKIYLRKQNLDSGALGQEEIRKLIEEIHVPSVAEKKKSVLDSIESIISRSNSLKEGTKISQIISRIERDPVFSSHFK